MSERLEADQLKDHVGREVDVTFRGRVLLDMTGDLFIDATAVAIGQSVIRTATSVTLVPLPVPDEPERIGSVVSVVVPNVSYPTYYARRFTRTDKDDCAPWMDLRSLDEHDWHSVVHGYGTPVEVTVVSEGVPNE